MNARITLFFDDLSTQFQFPVKSFQLINKL